MKVAVYKTRRRRDLYLYVPAGEGLNRVPQELLTTFGEPELALEFELTADRALAREDPVHVAENLRTEGYHLQLPPPDQLP